MEEHDEYICNLSPIIQRTLCEILDQNDMWEKLCIEMQYDNQALELFKMEKTRGKSPTNELLIEWGVQLNHTITELYHLLSILKLYSAMKCLKSYVHPKYHRMIREETDRDLFQLNNNEKEIEVLQNRIAKRSCIPETYLTQDDNLTTRACNNDDQIQMMKAEMLPPHIDYNELTIATNNWDTSRILGKGGYGTVYEGVWKWTKVAVKRLQTKSDKDLRTELEQSLRELQFLNQYKHDNILSVYGYSLTGDYPCLIYQYMSGNNLYRVLHPHKLSTEMELCPRTFNWIRRANVAIGVARGLHFLHTVGVKPLIHGDIKPANILLDACNEPKIGDFGLAREGPENDHSHILVSRIFGTQPYLPSDYISSKKMSTKLDTYSYGVVLFEIGTGLNVYVGGAAESGRHHKVRLSDHVLDYENDIIDLMDKRCPRENLYIYTILMNIGKKCVQKCANDRPEMKEILEEFCKFLNFC